LALEFVTTMIHQMIPYHDHDCDWIFVKRSKNFFFVGKINKARGKETMSNQTFQ